MFHASGFAVLLLCLAAGPAGAAADGAHAQPGREEIAPTYTLATLTLHKARQLHGKCIRICFAASRRAALLLL
jgi:hypothetical protein